MIHRQTQTREYWSAFKFTQDDSDFISNYLLEAGAPKPLGELTLLVIQHRVDKESADIRRDLEKRTLYQPKKTYAIGEEVLFPALKLMSGRVISQRPGHNPERSGFDVITVELMNGKKREFASNYAWPHRLNDDNVLATLSEDAVIKTPAELKDLYGVEVSAVIDAELARNPEFLRIADEWFLRALMAEVNIGHLNLAEAVLDVSSGGPLPTHTILQELGLPPDIAGSLQEISLNSALARDERFDDVSLDDGLSAWFLRRLEPPEVRATPSMLLPAFFNGDKAVSEELKQLAIELDDELSFDPSQPHEPAQDASLILTFPHRRAGTLGWTSRIDALLPRISKPRIPITFQERNSGKQFVVWLVREGAYIHGLGEWYRHNDLPAGAYLELSRTDSENVLLIDYKRRKPKREWVHVVSSREGHLRQETAQRQVACEFDELMAVFVDNPASMDIVRGDHPRDVAQAVREAFPEIAKLSTQGNVHARTLYAVVNVITRAAPIDVFAALQMSGAYIPVGDNYWHLSETR
ncbi:MAG TPA: hypothetical protein VGK87_04905 [Anaerolineae bacterium]